MEIVFSVNNNAEIKVMPVVPEFEIAEGQENETYRGLSLDIRMIGNKSLRTLSLNSFFPAKQYPFMSPYAEINPQAYIDFFKSIKTQRIPARIVISDNNDREVLNMAVSIDSFTYQYRKNGDVDYTLEMTEYVFVKAGGING